MVPVYVYDEICAYWWRTYAPCTYGMCIQNVCVHLLDITRTLSSQGRRRQGSQSGARGKIAARLSSPAVAEHGAMKQSPRKPSTSSEACAGSCIAVGTNQKQDAGQRCWRSPRLHPTTTASLIGTEVSVDTATHASSAMQHWLW